MTAPESIEAVAVALVESIRPFLTHEAWSERVYEWSPEEADAYRAAGGFTEGRAAAVEVRIKRVAQALATALAAREQDALGAVEWASRLPEATEPDTFYGSLREAIEDCYFGPCFVMSRRVTPWTDYRPERADAVGGEA